MIWRKLSSSTPLLECGMNGLSTILFIKMLSTLLIGLLYLTLNKTSSASAEREVKSNVIFIIVDDLRYLAIETVNLPNIKKITSRGVRFEHAYAQQALCAPSRNSLLTGRRPDSLRLYDFYSYWRDTAGNFTTIPQLFKENGYETYSVGKVFHPGLSSNYTDDYPNSWSHYPYHPPTEIYKDAAVCKDYITNKLESNLLCPVDVQHQPGFILPDMESLNYAIDILKERTNISKPYFMAVGFHKPHIPLKFPKEFLRNVPISKVNPPRFPTMPKQMPLVAWHPWTDVRSRNDIKRLNISFPLGTMPKKWTLKIRQSYYAAASYIDALIGVLLSYVDMRKTIIVLTSDHGWSLGENGMWAKYSNFDVALKVPLTFVAPDLAPNVVHTPVELVDVFPTLADLANLGKNIPKCKNNEDKRKLCFEGNNLKPMMEGYMIEKDFAISQYPRPSEYPQKNSDKPRLKHINIMGYSIKTKQFRYTEWVSFNNTSFKANWNKIYGLELYDHIIDPEESNNLYLVLKYKDIKIDLSKLLRSHVDPYYTVTNTLSTN